MLAQRKRWVCREKEYEPRRGDTHLGNAASCSSHHSGVRLSAASAKLCQRNENPQVSKA
jgi:hypothetical protein